MNRSKYIVLFISLFLLGACGGATAPVTPAQIPTTVSMAAAEYEGGIVLKLATDVTATADEDCSECEVVFTVGGTEVTDGSCGTFEISGEDITITGPDTWPNLESTCDLAVLYEDEPLDLTIAGLPSASTSMAKGLTKANGAVKSLTAYYDTSIAAVNQSANFIFLNDVITGGMKPSISKMDTTLHSCYVGLANQIIADSLIYAISTDDGSTFTDQFILRSSLQQSLYTPAGCSIDTRELASGEKRVVAILLGEPIQCSIDCPTTAFARISTDNGANFTSPFIVVPDVGSPEADSFSFIINEDGIGHGIARSSQPGQNGLNIVAFDDDINGQPGVVQKLLFADGTIGGGPQNISTDGQNIYVAYNDNRFETNVNNYNLVVTAFTFNSPSYTEGSTYRITTSSDTTGLVEEFQVSVDQDGLILVSWANPDTGVLYLSILDPLSGTIIDRIEVEQNVTNVGPTIASFSNNLNFFYVASGEGVFKLAESLAGVLTYSDPVSLGLGSDLLNAESDFVVGPDGRFYFMYSIGDSISIIKLEF
jgi:hypothetical protein